MIEAPVTPFTRIIRQSSSNEGSWMIWNGHQFPVLVQDAEAENRAGRHGVAVQDVSPMIKLRVKGRDAGSLLDRVATRKLSGLKPGRVAYAIFANASGLICDDATIFRLADDEFIIQSGNPLESWIRQHQGDLVAELTDVTKQWAELSVFGPKAAMLLKAAGIHGLEELKPFNFEKNKLFDAQIFISRTGFSGGLGYELLIPWNQAERCLQSLLDSKMRTEITFVGVQTGTTLRLEVGFLIPGWDFPVPGHGPESHPANYRNPFEMGLGWMVELNDQRDFIGKAALERIAREGPQRTNLVVVVDQGGALSINGSKIFSSDGAELGAVFIDGFSATLDRTVGFCLVDAKRCKAGDAVLVSESKITAKLHNQPLLTFKERTQTPPPGI